MRMTDLILPPITIVERDLPRLERLASAAQASIPVVAEFLSNEIARAEVEETVQRGLVVMGSIVVYEDNVTGEEHAGTLVYPDQFNLAENKISVLSPLGAALIGLTVGQSIEFPTYSGRIRSITVRLVNNSQLTC